MENSAYAPPKSTVAHTQEITPFFTTSNRKMWILFILTAGIYSHYWFYKHFKHQKLTNKPTIIPILRSIFYLFFIHSLFTSLSKTARQKSIREKYNLTRYAWVFIILSIISIIMDSFINTYDEVKLLDVIAYFFPLVTGIPMAIAQQTANAINNDPAGKANSQISILNYPFILLGVVYWMLTVGSILDPEMTFIENIVLLFY